MTTTQLLTHLATLTLTPAEYYADKTTDELFTIQLRIAQEARIVGRSGDEHNARRLVLAELLVRTYLIMREGRTMSADTLPNLERRVLNFFVLDTEVRARS